MVKHFKIKKRESLEIITSRLIEYIFENFLLVPSIMKIDLRKISKKINVKKRRLYDVANVLEGIGFLKKCKRNIMEINHEFANQILILKYKKAIKLETEIELIEKEIVQVNEEKKEEQINEENYSEYSCQENEDKAFEKAYKNNFNINEFQDELND